MKNGLYCYGTPFSGDLKTQCILQLGKIKFYKVDYNLTDKSPVTRGEKNNTKNKYTYFYAIVSPV